jgi:NTP pyrophosphatase (non-canonical NTP hydrolase)
MNLVEYQNWAQTLLKCPSMYAKLYLSMGLCEEAGEVAKDIKKSLESEAKQPTLSDKMHTTQELGDVLWYLAVLAAKYGWTLEELADINKAKLEERNVNK